MRKFTINFQKATAFSSKDDSFFIIKISNSFSLNPQNLLHPQFIIKVSYHLMYFDGRLKKQTVNVVFKKSFYNLSTANFCLVI